MMTPFWPFGGRTPNCWKKGVCEGEEPHGEAQGAKLQLSKVEDTVI
jgi:hypothetical protein